jgi:hypothetical protein
MPWLAAKAMSAFKAAARRIELGTMRIVVFRAAIPQDASQCCASRHFGDFFLEMLANHPAMGYDMSCRH